MSMRLVLGVAFALLTGCLVPVDLSEGDGGAGGGTGGGGGGAPIEGGEDAGVTDAGNEEDAGFIEDAGADAGVEEDAGSSEDAGFTEDAGVRDAGSPEDAGVGVPDAGSPEEDAGAALDAGELDDAGVPDAGPTDTLTLMVASELSGGIALRWDAGSLDLPFIVVLRDGVAIATLPGSAREFFDGDAGAGLLATMDAGASFGLPDGIVLTWGLQSSRGSPSAYEVSAQSLTSNAVVASRDAPTLMGWLIVRTDGGTETLDASVRSWLDVDTLLPSAGASPGITARPDDSTSAVMLSTDASVAPVEVEYSIEPITFEGEVMGERRSGARGGNPVLQWQRSTDDSPTTFVDLPMVHGPWWFDAEAVFNEGRYYRLVVKSGEVITGVSAPERALLWRPRLLAASDNVCILRDDDVALCGYGSSRPIRGTTTMRDVVAFVTDESNPCGLHTDGGVTCIINGVEQQIALPPVSELIGHSRLCGRSATGWVCAGPQPAPVSGFSSVFPTSHVTTVCGRSSEDGGTTCLSDSIYGPIEFGEAELVGVSRDQVCVIADGGIRCRAVRNGVVSVQPATLPSSSSPFVDLTVSGASYGFCVRQSDGFVRCNAETGGVNWGSNPPLSSEPFDQFVLSAFQAVSFGCGLTPDHRLRCGGEGFRQLPPTQPVRQVELGYGTQGALFLLENGRLAGRGRVQTFGGPAPEDRFVQLANTPTHGRVCGLRLDGSAVCWPASEPQPAAGKQYTAIAVGENSSCGLEADGSISCWRGGWVPTGTFNELMAINSALCGQRADLSFSCEGMPFPAPPTGRQFTRLAANNSNACGIRSDGYLECWPTPAPLQTVGRKFRDVSMAATTCAVGVDGTTLCWGGFVPSPVWTDLVSVRVGNQHACGVRSDRTATCWGFSFLWSYDP